MDLSGFSTLPTISAQHNNPLARTRITGMRQYRVGMTEELWFRVTATGFIGTDSRPHIMTFEVNVSNRYLVLSNFTSTFPNLSDEATAVVYRRQ